MADPILKIYSDSQKLAEKLASDFATHIRMLTNEKENVCIALSGGSTPNLFFDAIVKLNPDLPWNRIKFFWVDERCVHPDHPESNYGVARDRFLAPLNIPDGSVYRMRGEEDPYAEAERYSNLILDEVATELSFPVFDWVFLGMGTDGHTASVFPDQMHLWEAESLCTVARHPDSGQYRVTFTGPLINAARRVSLLVTGESKREKVREVIRHEESSTRYPVSRVSPYTGELEWYLDKQAAPGLE